jgi:hypothetical protein
MGTLNRINPNHMELTDISSSRSGESVVGSDYTVATDLHLHNGHMIYLYCSVSACLKLHVQLLDILS